MRRVGIMGALTNTKTTTIELTVHAASTDAHTHLSATGGLLAVCHDERVELDAAVLEGAPSCPKCRQVYDR